MNLDKLIINRPQNQSKTQKLTNIFVTTLAWSLWSYMWLPLIGLVGWYLGFEFFQKAMKDNGWNDFLKEVPSYINYVSIASGSLLVWAIANWYRFGGIRDKRAGGEHRVLTSADQAKYVGIRNSTLKTWQNSKRVVAHYHNSGKLSYMLTKENEPYQGIPSTPDPAPEELLAKSLHNALEVYDPKKVSQHLDIRIDLSDVEELSLIQKKIKKIDYLIGKYEKDLDLLSKLETPAQIVPLFAAQKRRLEQLKAAREGYIIRKSVLECAYDPRFKDKALEQTKIGYLQVQQGSAILDGRLYLEEKSAKDLAEALD